MISPSCRRSVRLFVGLLLLSCATLPVAAQEPTPPPRDTLRAPADTARAAAPDTLPAIDPALPDSVRPAVLFPAMPISPRVDAALTQWVWDRERLLREADVSLIDLLERIPGIATFRAGTFAQPEAAALFGGTAARTEIEIDGYIIDPLAASSFDLSQLTLGQLRELRVERRLGLLRIVMFTEFPESGTPYTRVEAGIGVPAANMFRGLFMLPHVIVGPLALGIERIDADGIGRREPASLFAGWAKWSWTNGQRGVQVEWLRNTLRREPESPWIMERVRQDFIVRGRNRFSDNFAAEVYVGRGQMEETLPDTAGDVRIERESVQAGVRAALETDLARVVGAVRYRSLDDLPGTEATLDAELSLGPFTVGGLAGIASWQGLEAEPFGSIRAEAGRVLGLAAFGEVSRGGRRAPSYAGDGSPASVFTEQNAWRAGLSLDLGRAAGGVALIRLDGGVVTPFGLPFDSAGLPATAPAADGLEAHGRVEILPGYLALTSWLTDWRNATGRVYLPSRSWRTALELHWLPLASGNLEILGRAEAHMRGSTVVYDGTPETAQLLTLGSYTTADTYLQIRIIDVRIFVRWEDILGADIQELPGRTYRGPRMFYGVKWNLWN